MTDVIVSAHNEEEHIGGVVTAALGAPSVSTVYVVCDACTDATAVVAAAAGAEVLRIGAHNKGTAMAAGLAHVSTADVLFMDGDLEGLTSGHVEGLLTAPPAGGQVVGIRGADLGAPVGRLGLPPISGERRLPTALARTVRLKGSGYGVELLIDAAVGRAGLPHRAYVMEGVHNPTRAFKSPFRWSLMWGKLLETTLVNLPELEAFVTHPDGR